MCESCGCGITAGQETPIHPEHEHMPGAPTAVRVLRHLLSENDHQAAHNREHFDDHGVLVVNLMSSPGAGKTSLLEATIDALGNELALAVIVGDLETENDAQRVRAHGVPAVQISTGSACHLDAHMVQAGLQGLDLEGADILFIENVGNLVCPASFDLGQHRNVTLLSVPEGDDKPAKYPVMFRAADLVVLTKTDLLPYLKEFSPDRAEQNLRALASEVKLIRTSTREPASFNAWLDWLRAEAAAQHSRVQLGTTRHSHGVGSPPHPGGEHRAEAHRHP